MKKRTRSRELTLQFLYQLDLRGADFVEEAAIFLREEEPDKSTREFVSNNVQRAQWLLDSLVQRQNTCTPFPAQR